MNLERKAVSYQPQNEPAVPPLKLAANEAAIAGARFARHTAKKKSLL